MNERLKIFIILALTLFTFVASDYLGSATEALRQEAIQDQKKLSRYMGLYERRDLLKDLSQRAEAQYRQIQKRIPKLTDPSEGFILLQKQIKEAIEKTHLTLRNITPMETIQEEEIFLLPVRITIEGSPSRLDDLLRSLNAEGMLLGLRSILIMKSPATGSIRAQITMEGYAMMDKEQ